MGHQMPADTAKAQLPLKYSGQGGVSFSLGIRENRQEAQSLEPFLFLVFPLPLFCKYIRDAFEKENYEVLLFLNDYKSSVTAMLLRASPWAL